MRVISIDGIVHVIIVCNNVSICCCFFCVLLLLLFWCINNMFININISMMYYDL